jgi:hypothetical protein
MKIQPAFVDALIEEAFEEILNSDTGPVDSGYQDIIDVLKRWVEEMEYDRPRNRAERILFEHLEAAIDHMAAQQKTLQSV